MPIWRPDLYKQFEKQRTQPSYDLARNIEVNAPKRIIDIGCGIGCSTMVLKKLWPDAQVVALDSSETMIASAIQNYPDVEWLHRDATDNLNDFGKFDIVFSNAVLQWVDQNDIVIPHLFDMLNTNGALAIQVPFHKYLPIYQEIIKLTKSDKWKPFFPRIPQYPRYHTYEYYNNILSSCTQSLSLWATDYLHTFTSHAQIVDWYNGSVLPAFLDLLPDSSSRENFIADYTESIETAYIKMQDGTIIMPLRRLFFIAYRS